MLQITHKMKGSSSKMLQIACSMEGKWQDRCRGRKTEQIRKKIPRAGEKNCPARSGTEGEKIPVKIEYLHGMDAFAHTRIPWSVALDLRVNGPCGVPKHTCAQCRTAYRPLAVCIINACVEFLCLCVCVCVCVCVSVSLLCLSVSLCVSLCLSVSVRERERKKERKKESIYMCLCEYVFRRLWECGLSKAM